TWWNLVADYHRYLARCQHLLQQGKAVADVLYLLPEGSPQVFTPPASALTGSGNIQDQRGYRFDACDPDTLIKYALVENGRISFASKQGNTFWVGGINRELPVTFGKKNPNATEYRLLVLPNVETMTPDLSWKIEQLVHMGATVVGLPPKKSPSLQKYFDLSRPTLAQHRPTADEEVRMVAGMLWGTTTPTAKSETRVYHQGKIITLPRENVTGVPLRMAGAKWIWFPEGNPAHDAPSGTRFFRKTFSLPEGAKIDDARFLATADNDLTVKINGKEVYKTSYPSPLKIVSFAEILKSGENVIELEAVNSPSDLRNPAGLIANFVVRTIDKNGETALIQMTTDATWNSSQDGKDWRQAAKVLGDFGMSPWSVAEYSGAAAGGAGAELYPDYQFTAKILAAEGLAEDFVSPNESLRFFHRQDGETEIYFVANKKNEPFQADVSFRVTDKKASIWNPQTGKKFRTPPTTENKSKGQTTLNLFLEGSESVFVIFDQHGADASLPVWQKTELPRTVLELDKDWTVFFEPKRGAPEKAEFAQLTDLSKHPEDGIKYFSGIATYQKTFNIKKQNNQPLFLDLGNVEVMARVHLNGKLVGTCWIAPYRLEITDDVKDGENELRVEVANLWANRLIGDAALPADKRVTWSTWNGGYKADSKLMPSSLIGPVKILSPLP
ncbi:MAG: hypothetical protein LBQ66_06435, partial [Planctomycetaceae bacterium]|nr:hypothetical protein [Planctomycetaceae bacterium]